MQRKPTILIVDDKPENLLALQTSLAALPVEFVAANSGNEALVASLHYDFAAAIVDVQMPDMDGYELAELLRSDPRTAHLPILFMSAYYREDHHVFRGYEAGAVDFIVKPYKSEVLLNKLRFFLLLDEQRRALIDKIALQESQGFLQSILTSMGDAVVVEIQGRVAMMNDAARELLGYSADEAIGRELDAIVVGGLASLQTRKGPHRGRLRAADGEEIPVRVTLSSLKDRPGQVLLATDLRPQLEAERARAHLEEQLKHMMRMESIGRLAGGVAHDLNNVFTIIQVCCGLLKEDADIRGEPREDVEQALQAAHQGEALVRQLLAIGRKQELDPRPVDLREVVSEAFDMIGRIIGKRIEVVQVPWPDEVVIVVDRDQMIQVLVNLALNARDAMAAGGQLTVTTGVDASSPGWGFVEVRDNGSGMTPEVRQHIFEPFFTTKGPDDGTGLGLSVVHGIVSQSGGKIEVQSTPGVGSAFRVSFAQTSQPTEPPPPSTSRPVLSLNDTPILVVEDNRAVLRMVVRLLKRAGYTVLEANTMQGALDIARSQKNLGLLCSDLNLRECTGLDVATEIRNIHPSLPVLFISGNAEKLLEGNPLDGRIGFLQKPFAPREFLDRMQSVVENT